MLRATATALVMLLFAAMSANVPVFGQDKPPDYIERVDPGDFEQVIPGDSERVDPETSSGHRRRRPIQMHRQSSASGRTRPSPGSARLASARFPVSPRSELHADAIPARGGPC